MDVLIVNFGTRGGMAQYPALLCNSLDEHVNLEVCLTTDSEFDEYLNSKIDRLYVDKTSRLTAMSDLRSILANTNCDIIHIPFFTGWPARISLLLAKFHSIPTAITVHDPKSHSGDAPYQRFVSQLVRKKFSSFADLIFVHGENTYSQANELGYPLRKVNKIRHGQYSHFPNDGDTLSKFYDVLVFGNIKKYKGYDRLPDIANRVRNTKEDFSMLVAGPESEECQSEIERLRSHDCIDVDIGYIPVEEVQRYFNSSKIALLPYYDATSSGVLMTSYTFETPVVVSDTGDIGKYVREAEFGIVAPENSEFALSQSILQLLSDEDRYEYFVDNMRNEDSIFNWGSISKDLLEEYRRVVN